MSGALPGGWICNADASLKVAHTCIHTATCLVPADSTTAWSCAPLLAAGPAPTLACMRPCTLPCTITQHQELRHAMAADCRQRHQPDNRPVCCMANLHLNVLNSSAACDATTASTGMALRLDTHAATVVTGTQLASKGTGEYSKYQTGPSFACIHAAPDAAHTTQTKQEAKTHTAITSSTCHSVGSWLASLHHSERIKLLRFIVTAYSLPDQQHCQSQSWLHALTCT